MPHTIKENRQTTLLPSLALSPRAVGLGTVAYWLVAGRTLNMLPLCVVILMLYKQVQTLSNQQGDQLATESFVLDPGGVEFLKKLSAFSPTAFNHNNIKTLFDNLLIYIKDTSASRLGVKTSNERLRKAEQAREFAYLLARLMDPAVQFEAANDNFQSNPMLYLNLFVWKHCLKLTKEISDGELRKYLEKFIKSEPLFFRLILPEGRPIFPSRLIKDTEMDVHGLLRFIDENF